MIQLSHRGDLMKQFCPECCKWYDLDCHFCPKCDVVVYSETECNDTLKRGKNLKIVSRTKVKKMYTKGVFFLAFGIALIVTILIWVSLFNGNSWSIYKSPTEIILECIPGLLIIGNIILICLGIRFVSTYKSMNRKIYSTAPKKETPIIICPYCHSGNTTKITTLNRAGSIMITGVASGKIGKQWHCNNCTSDF